MLLLNSKKGVITFNAPHVGETKHAPHVGRTERKGGSQGAGPTTCAATKAWGQFELSDECFNSI